MGVPDQRTHGQGTGKHLQQLSSVPTTTTPLVTGGGGLSGMDREHGADAIPNWWGRPGEPHADQIWQCPCSSSRTGIAPDCRRLSRSLTLNERGGSVAGRVRSPWGCRTNAHTGKELANTSSSSVACLQQQHPLALVAGVCQGWFQNMVRTRCRLVGQASRAARIQVGRTCSSSSRTGTAPDWRGSATR